MSGDKIANEAHLMEQLVVTKSMRKMVHVLKKHEGHASQMITEALNANSVGNNVYHTQSIDRNHCMNFGEENGKKCFSQIVSAMINHINKSINIQYVGHRCSQQGYQ